MAETKLPVKTESKKGSVASAWHPLDDLRREVDRLFERGELRLVAGKTARRVTIERARRTGGQS